MPYDAAERGGFGELRRRVVRSASIYSVEHKEMQNDRRSAVLQRYRTDPPWASVRSGRRLLGGGLRGSPSCWYVNEDKCRRLKMEHAQETTAKNSNTRRYASLGAWPSFPAETSPQNEKPGDKIPPGLVAAEPIGQTAPRTSAGKLAFV